MGLLKPSYTSTAVLAAAMDNYRLFGFASILALLVLRASAAVTSVSPTSVAPATPQLPGQNGTSGRQFSDPGTDPDLREIFIGRCADYKAGKVNPTVDLDELREKNCTHLWELFSSAFVNQDACAVNLTHYQPFVEAAGTTIPTNKSNFWDGWNSYPTVRAYANEGTRTWTIEWYIVGYLINNLKFCGQEGGSGIRYDSCPAEGECGFGKGSIDAFWAAASTNFAKEADGNVYLFLDSNREGGAFQVNESFFTSFELVNLSPEKVSNVDIYLITQLGDERGDDCSSESIMTLKQMLGERALRYTCYDQPRDVLHMLCIDNTNHPDCTLLRDIYASPTEGGVPSPTNGGKSMHRMDGVTSVLAGSVFFAFSLLRLLQSTHTT